MKVRKWGLPVLYSTMSEAQDGDPTQYQIGDSLRGRGLRMLRGPQSRVDHFTDAAERAGNDPHSQATRDWLNDPLDE